MGLRAGSQTRAYAIGEFSSVVRAPGLIILRSKSRDRGQCAGTVPKFTHPRPLRADVRM